MSPKAGAIIRSFCEAWSNGDLDKIMGFFDESAVYHNIPMEPAEGLENIRTFIEGFFAMATSIHFEIIHQVVEGDVVMNERVDTLVMGENTIELPVAGIFELANGKIVKWRDYFDMGQLSGQG
ncbi:MAG: limonene-1,2-epoxide hydrolase family protein [Acidimicrobiales bacterium]|jgi:limonene-1,2-epoxide hydrolase|nr:limonene-1,2-epoxide hydrolase family protein [Acidimicrobiales bacterium]MDP6298722.1 limonene-1,2-epoxide hydrolase family protein [Acidimicrobiales bacterium]HJM28038.1 limonene-1,2-epoxide hydrolase family protein [Acidimicrobiales bacterium]HJM96615.1 limonene-1,2-epoxide hydrolase family protein [Acidimicrobiales bacterium]